MILSSFLTAILLYTLIKGPQIEHLKWKQWHHGYLGILIVMLGILLHSDFIQDIGNIILADDAFQHSVQRFLNEPQYRSPMHKLFYELN